MLLFFCFRSTAVKSAVIKYLNEEAEQWLESPMTYTLFEGLKEKFDEFISIQEEAPPVKIEEAVSKLVMSNFWCT